MQGVSSDKASLVPGHQQAWVWASPAGGGAERPPERWSSPGGGGDGGDGGDSGGGGGAEDGQRPLIIWQLWIAMQGLSGAQASPGCGQAGGALVQRG